MARVGVVGYGLAGEVFHCPLIDATPGLELAAVVTGDAGRASRARLRHPGVRVVPTFERLIRDGDDIDLLVVATPNRLHLSQARAGLERGWHVVVDKPLALSAEHGEALAEIAQARGLLLSVFHNRRWDDDFILVKSVIGSGRLGTIRVLESRFERWRPRLREEGWRDTSSPEQGGGLLLDLGSHLIDQALELLGPPESVYAELRRRRGGAADDDCFLALRFGDGALGLLHMSAVAAALGPRFRVLGMAGAIETWGLDPQEERLRRSVAPDEWLAGPAGPEHRAEFLHQGQTSGGGEELTLPAGSYSRFYVAMEAALRGLGPVPIPVSAGIRALRVIEAARRSAVTNEVVHLGAVDAG